jgi:ComF family protein
VIRRPGAVIRAAAHHWSRAFFDILYPPSCVGCGETGTDWCKTCEKSLRRISRPICAHCGSPLPRNQIECFKCTDFPENLRIRSYAYYEGPLLKAVLHLKYRPNQQLAEAMGKWLVELAIEEGMEADIILAVPLSKKRMKHRGYNQVDLITSHMAKQLGITREKKALKRIRETKSQVGLDPINRHLNVQNAFQANHEILENQRVFLVDDLFTTGATMLACTGALQKVGVRTVFGLTVARA